jgi:hypothetical protein
MAVPKFILSFPGILNIPHFTRTGIINFFINYENMYKDYNIKERERVRRYSQYCVKYIVIIIKGLASFIEPD